MNVLEEISLKEKFLFLLDYQEHHDMKLPNSFDAGICKLEVDDTDNVLYVYARRPGLIIGRRSETLDLLQKQLGCKIMVHAVVLSKF